MSSAIQVSCHFADIEHNTPIFKFRWPAFQKKTAMRDLSIQRIGREPTLGSYLERGMGIIDSGIRGHIRITVCLMQSSPARCQDDTLFIRDAEIHRLDVTSNWPILGGVIES